MKIEYIQKLILSQSSEDKKLGMQLLIAAHNNNEININEFEVGKIYDSKWPVGTGKNTVNCEEGTWELIDFPVRLDSSNNWMGNETIITENFVLCCGFRYLVLVKGGSMKFYEEV